ncbi:hypothetical protein Sjap_013125 [Stephania japonica]|uniref:Uncharacterized protein n=1 Tax=Stephania japonica TaxID=461633 RepID=A0AAP0IXI9_9MAGN
MELLVLADVTTNDWKRGAVKACYGHGGRMRESQVAVGVARRKITLDKRPQLVALLPDHSDWNIVGDHTNLRLISHSLRSGQTNGSEEPLVVIPCV